MLKVYKRFFLLTSIFLFGFLFNKNIFAETVGKINFQDTEIFSNADNNSDILKTLPSGQAVEILESKNDFYKILLEQDKNKKEVYVKKNFVDLVSAEGLVNAENVNIRALPYEDAQIISKKNIGDKININAVAGDWYAISFNKNKAYIAKKFVICDFENVLPKIDLPKHKFAIVTSDNGLNLREGKSTETNSICSLACDSVLDVVDENINSDWVNVAFENNFGYVKSDYVKISDQKPEIKKEIQNDKADKIIEFAKKFIGTRYQYGGRDLKKGVDCSGFVRCVMQNFDISLNSSSKTQLQNGHKVENRSDLKKGDLVFFSNYGRQSVEHVGIYIGNHNFIHSASAGGVGVKINSLDENYYDKNYITARRVI